MRGKPFQKGNKGKPKGTLNKLTRTVKETVLEVFNNIQNDPKNNLSAFAQKYPRDFYAIAAKLIPTEVNAKVENDMKVTFVEVHPKQDGADSQTEPGN